ncbi:MAG: hypothetical protein FWE24_11150 [Defluviitaleaceae bacterium]|nr:hypothetical protein [Defluviitaleaceae bacterium]
MNCANIYCIYNRRFECILDEINLDSIGMCDDCIMVNLDEYLLEAEKERQFLEFEKRLIENGN